MAKVDEVIVRVGGAAGQGGASTGETIARTFSRHGLHVCTYTSYQSAIRGGHNWIQVRASHRKVHSQGDGLDVLLALNPQTVELHAPAVDPGGAVIYNEQKVKNVSSYLKDGVQDVGLPADSMARKYGNLPIQNTIMVGALAYLIGLRFEILASAIESTFGRKQSQIAQMNVDAAHQGWSYANEHFKPLDIKLQFADKPKLMMTGNNAFGLGAVVAGCKFYSAYPMTPASSLLHWMAAHSQKYGVLVKQAEDELAVINMAIGAAFAGVRAMCGTSGGGFSLMVEGCSLAGMTETPVVIIEAQRGAPSTGLPTKTEQADLFLMLGAGQGDYPKIILAPRSVEECFYTAAEAFNLAEKYQCPVIIASDLYLSEHYETIEGELDLAVPIDRGLIAQGDGGRDGGEFKRYEVTEDGISPRAFPGQEGTIFVAASDEHDEKGELISDVRAGLPESIVVRRRQMEKRMRKLQKALEDMKPPSIYGPNDADLTFVGWGGTWGAIKDAMLKLEEEGIRTNSVQFKYIWPFRAKESAELLNRCKRLLLVENNYSGQFGRLLRMETGIEIRDKLLKYDGEPIYPGEVVNKAKEVLGYVRG